MQRTRLISILLTVAVGILAAGAGMWLSSKVFRKPQTPVAANATVLQPARKLPDFSLLDDAGAPFTPANLSQHWTLLFFGFTRCPAICPNTLTVLQQAKAALADLPADKQPQIVFVSVDPERDTPPAMREYVRFFGPTLRGVTGPLDRITNLAEALGVPFNRVELPGGDYTMDHSAAIFLINPRGEFNALFSAPQTAPGLAGDYRIIVNAAS